VLQKKIDNARVAEAGPLTFIIETRPADFQQDLIESDAAIQKSFSSSAHCNPTQKGFIAAVKC
jgi:hypothetical protein